MHHVLVYVRKPHANEVIETLWQPSDCVRAEDVPGRWSGLAHNDDQTTGRHHTEDTLTSDQKTLTHSPSVVQIACPLWIAQRG